MSPFRKIVLILAAIAAFFGVWALLVDTPGPKKGLLQRVVAYFSRNLKDIDERIAKLREEQEALPVQPQLQQTARVGYRLRSDVKDTTAWVSIDLGRSTRIDSVVLVPVEVVFGELTGPGYGFPQQFRIEVADDADFSEPTLIAAYEDKDFENPKGVPVVVNADEAVGRYVRVLATKLWILKDKNGFVIGDQHIFALGELMVLSGPLNIAAGLPADAISSSPESYELFPPWGKANLVDGQSILGPPVSGKPGPNGAQSATRDRSEFTPPEHMEVDLGGVYDLQEIRLLPALPSERPEQRGFGFPGRFKVEVSTNSNFIPSRLIGEFGGGNQLTSNPYESPFSIRAEGQSARVVRVTANSLYKSDRRYLFALGELQVFSDGKNVAQGKEARQLSRPAAPERNLWKPEYLVDGATSRGQLRDWPVWLQGLDRRKEVERMLSEFVTQREATAERLVETVIRTAGFVVFGLALFSAYLSVRSQVRKRRALEALRTRIARDIHDEVGSGIGTISLLSQIAQESDPEQAREDLEEIHRISVGLAESMRDIVWFNRTDVDSVRDLLMRMRETADTMLSGKEVHFTTLGDELVKPITMDRRREIFLIFKEAMHNIVKHAQATEVHVTAGIDETNFLLTIKDNGQGFDTALERSGTGLRSMKERARDLKGQITWDSARGSGTTLSLKASLR